MMPWYVAVMVGLIPLATCYFVFPWFRAAVNRRLTFKPLDYDALTEIYRKGMPNALVIECLQARYRANVEHHSHVDIYPHGIGMAVIRFVVDEKFPVARIFHDVLSANISALCIKSKKAPKIEINQSVYQVLEYEYDDQFLLIYVKH